MKKVMINIDEATAARLALLGNGNLSGGVRRIVRTGADELETPTPLIQFTESRELWRDCAGYYVVDGDLAAWREAIFHGNDEGVETGTRIRKPTAAELKQWRNAQAVIHDARMDTGVGRAPGGNETTHTGETQHRKQPCGLATTDAR